MGDFNCQAQRLYGGLQESTLPWRQVDSVGPQLEIYSHTPFSRKQQN